MREPWPGRSSTPTYLAPCNGYQTSSSCRQLHERSAAGRSTTGRSSWFCFRLTGSSGSAGNAASPSETATATTTIAGFPCDGTARRGLFSWYCAVTPAVGASCPLGVQPNLPRRAVPKSDSAAPCIVRPTQELLQPQAQQNGTICPRQGTQQGAAPRQVFSRK